MHFDHIGWITIDISAFERFWVSVLGFELVKTSKTTPEMMNFLFGVDKSAEIRRYRNTSFASDIEIHHFADNPTVETPFNRTGINHVCIWVDNKDGFLKTLPPDIPTKIYKNPGGWTNVFINDYEGNWIELREPM